MDVLNFVTKALEQVASYEWAKKAVILPCTEQGWSTELFGVDALKWLLVSARIPEECFRVMNNGKMQPHRTYSRPILVGQRVATHIMDGTKVTKALQEGASLILSALEEFWEPISILCKELGAQMGTQCSAFGVITPPNSSGFVPHVDRTDQLVIQCQGHKTWRVYDIVDRSNVGLPVQLEHIGTPIIESEIGEGQMLYLPQCAPHVARTTDSLSAHITLTFEPIAPGQWVNLALNDLINNDDYFMTSLPPFYYKYMSEHLHSLNSQFEDILERLLVHTNQIANEKICSASLRARRGTISSLI